MSKKALQRAQQSAAAARGNSAHVVAARPGRPTIDSVAASRSDNAHVPATRFEQDMECALASTRDVVHRGSASQPVNIIVYNGPSDASAPTTSAFPPTNSGASSHRAPNDINKRLSLPADHVLHSSSGAHASPLTEAKSRRQRRRTLRSAIASNPSSLHTPATSSADFTYMRDAPSAASILPAAQDLPPPPPVNALMPPILAPPAAPADDRFSALTEEIQHLRRELVAAREEALRRELAAAREDLRAFRSPAHGGSSTLLPPVAPGAVAPTSPSLAPSEAPPSLPILPKSEPTSSRSTSPSQIARIVQDVLRRNAAARRVSPPRPLAAPRDHKPPDIELWRRSARSPRPERSRSADRHSSSAARISSAASPTSTSSARSDASRYFRHADYRRPLRPAQRLRSRSPARGRRASRSSRSPQPRRREYAPRPASLAASPAPPARPARVWRPAPTSSRVLAAAGSSSPPSPRGTQPAAALPPPAVAPPRLADPASPVVSTSRPQAELPSPPAPADSHPLAAVRDSSPAPTAPPVLDLGPASSSGASCESLLETWGGSTSPAWRDDPGPPPPPGAAPCSPPASSTSRLLGNTWISDDESLAAHPAPDARRSLLPELIVAPAPPAGSPTPLAAAHDASPLSTDTTPAPTSPSLSSPIGSPILRSRSSSATPTSPIPALDALDILCRLDWSPTCDHVPAADPVPTFPEASPPRRARPPLVWPAPPVPA